MIRGSCNENCSKSSNCSNFNNTNKKIENMIEYNGINRILPKNPTTFTQFSLNKTLCIPIEKPDIERIVRIDTKIIIDKYEIIKTPKGTSLEGQILTGCKLIVYGRITQLMMYVANETEQSVHSAHFEEYFCKYIVLPKNFNKFTSIKVIPSIEDISITDYDNRCFCECINIFLDTRLCVNCEKCIANDCHGLLAKPLGINEYLPEKPLYFKELIIEDTLLIPTQKPKIEGLISITSDIEIISSKIICTENKKSLEGQNLSGCKLIIEYRVKDSLVYTAQKITQPVHSAHYESNLKSTFVVIPCEINGVDTQTLLENCKLKITPYIEDICAMKKCDKVVNRCITLFIDVIPRCI